MLDAVSREQERCRLRQARSGASRRLPGTQFQYIVNAEGRLQTEQEFGSIVVKTGAQGKRRIYAMSPGWTSGPIPMRLRSMLDGTPAVAIPVVSAAWRECAGTVAGGTRHHEGAREELSAKGSLRNRL